MDTVCRWDIYLLGLIFANLGYSLSMGVACSWTFTVEVTGKNKGLLGHHLIISYKNIPIHFFMFLKLTLDCSMLEDKDLSAKSGSTVLKM